MTDTEFAIPVFQPGQRVKVDMSLYEVQCPHCHLAAGGYSPNCSPGSRKAVEIGTVIERMPTGELVLCANCLKEHPVGAGYWDIMMPNGTYMAVPWTRLKALDD